MKIQEDLIVEITSLFAKSNSSGIAVPAADPIMDRFYSMGTLFNLSKLFTGAPLLVKS